jgi:glutamyl-tRNA synthetase
MRNYLARLGWSHGDDEFFTDAQALEWFDITGIKRAPARLDPKKLAKLSGQHMAQMDDDAILAGIDAYFAAAGKSSLTEPAQARLRAALPCLRGSARTYPELLEKARFALTYRPIERNEKAAATLDTVSKRILSELTPHLQNATWSREDLEGVLTNFAETQGMKFGALAAPLRAALAGRTATPSVYDMMLVLGQAETLARITDATA